MATTLATKFYQSRIATLTLALEQQKKQQTTLGWLRLAAIAIPAFVIYKFWPLPLYLTILIAVIALILFLWLVSKAQAVEEGINDFNRQILINKDELQILQGEYTHRPDGAAFLSQYQLPDNDLDLFGKASLFQYINRAVSEHGQQKLAESLLLPGTMDSILQKQKAVQELASKTLWRQQLQSNGLIEPITKKAEFVILDWMNDDSDGFQKPIWQVLRYAVPAISFSILFIYLGNIISDGFFNTAMLLMLVFVFLWYKKFTKQYSQLSKIIPQLNAFLPVLQCIETASFQSEWLQEKQQHLLRDGNASREIADIKNILKRFDYRLNPVVHLPLSVFFFWDLQQILLLNKWKKQQTGHISKWFETAGDFEMISSLSTLSFNQPSWVFPEIAETWFDLECKEIGHPLIKESKLVSNIFNMKNAPEIALITGSNMAGKSTFLRTVGANMVLAMAGAPVRASHMKLPVVSTICSMRITDNLEEETSTFYAELKKIKRIVEAVNEGEKVFILIDEMLRGTNALDRYTGSVALIKQLLRHNAVGIIASHDVALADLEKSNSGAIRNYHFDSSISDGEIVFDYLLKDGVCTSTNASLLMKKIGIELQ